MVFLLTAAGILHLIRQLSSNTVLLHHLIASPTIVGLLLLLFGSWKVVKATSQPGEPLETDDEGEFEERERLRKQECVGAKAALIVSFAALLAAAWHIYWGFFLIHMPTLVLTVLVVIVATVLTVNFINSYSELKGYQVAFRLGVIIVIATFLFLIALWEQDLIAATWRQVVPFEYAGVSMLSFLMGASLWLPANMLYPYEAAVQRLVDTGEVNGLQQLFYYAALTFQQVSVTLVDDKVYIGYVDSEIPVAGRTDNFVKVLPTVSGYRENPSKRLRITTSYLDALERHASEGGADLSSSDLAKVIPIDQIRSAGIFHPKLYTEFQSAEIEDSEEDPEEAFA